MTMTVKDLINKLKGMDENMPVMLEVPSPAFTHWTEIDKITEGKFFVSITTNPIGWVIKDELEAHK